MWTNHYTVPWKSLKTIGGKGETTNDCCPTFNFSLVLEKKFNTNKIFKGIHDPTVVAQVFKIQFVSQIKIGNAKRRLRCLRMQKQLFTCLRSPKAKKRSSDYLKKKSKLSLILNFYFEPRQYYSMQIFHHSRCAIRFFFFEKLNHTSWPSKLPSLAKFLCYRCGEINRKLHLLTLMTLSLLHNNW